MERKIIKKIGNLEMDDKGIVYKTGKGGFIPPPLPEEYKIPYPKIQLDDEPICGLYASEIEDACARNDVDYANKQKEIQYQRELRSCYRDLERIRRKQKIKRIARQPITFLTKAIRSYREYRR